MAHTPEVSRYLGGVLHGKLVSLADRARLVAMVEDPKVKTPGDFPAEIQALIYAIETDTNDQSTVADAPPRRR